MQTCALPAATPGLICPVCLQCVVCDIPLVLHRRETGRQHGYTLKYDRAGTSDPPVHALFMNQCAVKRGTFLSCGTHSPFSPQGFAL